MCPNASAALPGEYQSYYQLRRRGSGRVIKREAHSGDGGGLVNQRADFRFKFLIDFQTILASYFVSVDCMLFSQYIYYGLLRRSKNPIELPYDYDYEHPSSPVPTHAHSGVHPPRMSPVGRRRSAEVTDRHHYRELSTAAANLAIAAAFAASEEEIHSHVRTHSQSESRSRVNTSKTAPTSPTSPSHSPIARQRPAHRRSSTSITRSEAEEAEDEVDEQALAALTESFHSDIGGTVVTGLGGRRRSRSGVSWGQSQDRGSGGRGGSTSRSRTRGSGTISGFTTMHSHHQTYAHPPLRVNTADGVLGSDPSARGRPRQRQLELELSDSPIDAMDLEGQVHEDISGTRTRTRSGISMNSTKRRDRKDSRASQRSVWLVFLGVWALFGVGGLSSEGSRFSSGLKGLERRGVVLGEVVSSVSTSTNVLWEDSSPSIVDDASVVFVGASGEADDEPSSSSELVVGRIFAWLCTTLYLTSRLPQIWKNVS
jgi:solute carrier family 66 (lysosomal lysine-arginine transporter), member 1